MENLKNSRLRGLKVLSEEEMKQAQELETRSGCSASCENGYVEIKNCPGLCASHDNKGVECWINSQEILGAEYCPEYSGSDDEGSDDDGSDNDGSCDDGSCDDGSGSDYD